MSLHCPCCASEMIQKESFSDASYRCDACLHRWRQQSVQTEYYRHLAGRNSDPATWRKYKERADALRPWLAEGARLLEVGCAEGELGRQVKSIVALDYTGIELSRDAEAAAKVLDRVFRVPAAQVPVGLSTGVRVFDGLVSFHVLEHIEDLLSELRCWRTLIHDDGWMMLEVPHGSGHPNLAWDRNPEHIHQFSPASLACLLARSGFDVRQLTGGHYESPAYPDSLRVMATPARGEAGKQERLVQAFLACLTGPALAWGLGGDFENYVRPVIGRLPIVGLLDRHPERHGGRLAGCTVERYDARRHSASLVLVSSMKFEQEIVDELVGAGHPAERIVRLSGVLEA